MPKFDIADMLPRRFSEVRNGKHFYVKTGCKYTKTSKLMARKTFGRNDLKVFAANEIVFVETN